MSRGRWESAFAYAAAIVAVALAYALTASSPTLHDRFTFFLFWPLVLLASWLGGLGPGLVTTGLSALAVAALLGPRPGGTGQAENLALSLGGFALTGAGGALLARWRERATQALRASRTRFATLADAAPVLIWESGADGGRHDFNGRWLEFTGRTLAQERGDGWLEGVHPEDRARCAEARAAAVASGGPLELEYRLRRRDGVHRTVCDRGLPRRDASGALVGWIGAALDVSELHAARAQAEQARDRAEAASRAKDAFLATVSHELRTPLSPILTWARMLRDGLVKPEERERALDAIERNARAEAQLVEDLLDVSRIGAGKLHLDVRPIAIGDAVERALETVRPAAEARGVCLQVALDASLATVCGDPDRIQQIVWNLLANAVKFTPRGGRVHVALERVDSHVEVAVTDTGPGIAAAELPHLFERFWQADGSPARSHGGLGLGLAIARHLAELHGGTLVAESPGAGRGATFTLKLPVIPIARMAGEAERRRPAAPELAPRAPRARLEGVSVLVVDDDLDASDALRLLLERRGARVEVAASAEAALARLRSWAPDVLLSDIGMPGLDGYGLLARLRAGPGPAARVPAIALTAYAGVADRVRALSAGFQMHLAKPADPVEIAAAVAALAGHAPRS